VKGNEENEVRTWRRGGGAGHSDQQVLAAQAGHNAEHPVRGSVIKETDEKLGGDAFVY